MDSNLEKVIREISDDLTSIKSALLGDLDGKRGLIQKTDDLHTEIRQMKEEHQALHDDVSALKQDRFKRHGMLVGIGLVAGTTLVELFRKFTAWLR
jgi:archaellum component FlaC